MDTNRLFLHSLIAEPHSITLNDCTNKLNKLSYLSKKPYNLVNQFEYEFNKEIIELALEHGLFKVFEVGFSTFEVNHALIILKRNNHLLTKAEQSKLLKDCDTVADWIRGNINTVAENETLTHDSYHKLSSLYSTLKRLKTKD
jgi:hypothetical protein|uniref:Uncharacterized protein n=1 Tax=Siphoviridae sp. ctHip2 TaxID=2827830 RepID=A0A8S5RVQ0_9CAUD|nr:MAG TPA: hypothetical protein [Siphoviridae sp. ctHip2]